VILARVALVAAVVCLLWQAMLWDASWPVVAIALLVAMVAGTAICDSRGDMT